VVSESIKAERFAFEFNFSTLSGSHLLLTNYPFYPFSFYYSRVVRRNVRDSAQCSDIGVCTLKGYHRRHQGKNLLFVILLSRYRQCTSAVIHLYSCYCTTPSRVFFLLKPSLLPTASNMFVYHAHVLAAAPSRSSPGPSSFLVLYR